MTGFRGKDGSGRVVEDLTPASLRTLLHETQDFVVVENPAWGSQHFAQAVRVGDTGAWRAEVRGGGCDRNLGTNAPNLDAVYDILRSWAAGDGWWQEAFTWTTVRT